MKNNVCCILLFLLAISLWPSPAVPDDGTGEESRFVSVVDFTYNFGKGDTKAVSRAIALFGAKHKAVLLSAKYLTHRGLLEHYGKKQREVFCLATDEIGASIIDEKFYEKSNAYYVKIKAVVRSTDFIKAEIKNSDFEIKELKFSYNKEMEQYVSESIEPGQELSRAYRYIRRGKWRIAIIYLNHLEKKYPNWGEVYLAKAFGFYGIHNVEKMMAALKTACLLDNQEACKDLESLTYSDED